MSLPFRIHAPSPRLSFTTTTKTLLHVSGPPESPFSQQDTCGAIESNGSNCASSLSIDHHALCSKHLAEMTTLEDSWYALQVESSKVVVRDTDSARRKVQKLRLAVELRRQIRGRFFPRGGDAMDYIAWITDIERELQGLADYYTNEKVRRHGNAEVCGTPHPDTKSKGKDLFHVRSVSNPRISPETSGEGREDEVLQILKKFYFDLCSQTIQRLYCIAPDLNDATSFPATKNGFHDPDDAGTEAVRAWFRIMVFNDSGARTLERATRTDSIDKFLRGSSVSQLEKYCDFFERAWRPHAMQYLRVAIYGQTLAGRGLKAVTILGGTIPGTTKNVKMRKPCWDILYRLFPKLLTSQTLTSICWDFDDFVTINKLLMIGMYADHWLDKTSIISRCPTAVYLGFLPFDKGDFSQLKETNVENGMVTQKQGRNYLLGQMAIGDPVTTKFLEELGRRTKRILLVAYEGTNVHPSVCPSDQEVYVYRSRSARKDADVKQTKWSVKMTVEDIENDFKLRMSSMHDTIVADSWQIIIIDREPGRPFELFEIVQDALLMVHGDPSVNQLARQVVQSVIPQSAQEVFIQEMRVDRRLSMLQPPPPMVHYEGNRQRSWLTDKALPRDSNPVCSAGQSRNATRFIQQVTKDMENHGIIKLLTKYEEVHTKPVVIQGSDGLPDIYFPYDTSHRPASTQESLLRFAMEYKNTHPHAVMAKGSIAPHYCAWPMAADPTRRLTFATSEGHLYEWLATPFDAPQARETWDSCLAENFGKFDFVKFNLTTFVICAADRSQMARSIEKVYEVVERRGWRLMIPEPENWTVDLGELRLSELFQGIAPAAGGDLVRAGSRR